MNGLMRMAGLAGLVWITLSTGACGPAGNSQYQTWQFERAVEEMARSTRRAGAVSPPAPHETKSPAAGQPKTTESTRQYDERHPSRWKRKLKAAYA